MLSTVPATGERRSCSSPGGGSNPQVTGRRSRVTGRGSRVAGRRSRVAGRRSQVAGRCFISRKTCESGPLHNPLVALRWQRIAIDPGKSRYCET